MGLLVIASTSLRWPTTMGLALVSRDHLMGKLLYNLPVANHFHLMKENHRSHHHSMNMSVVSAVGLLSHVLLSEVHHFDWVHSPILRNCGEYYTMNMNSLYLLNSIP